MTKRIYNLKAEAYHGLTIYTGSFKKRDIDRHGLRRGKTFTVIVDKTWNKTIVEVSTWEKGYETSRETVDELKGYVAKETDIPKLLSGRFEFKNNEFIF